MRRIIATFAMVTPLMSEPCAVRAEPVANNAASTPAYKQPPRPLARGFQPYPPEAIEDGHQGLVRLRLTINAKGDTDDIKLLTSSRSPALDRAAMQAASVWRFAPALDANGQPVATIAVQDIMYRKDSEDSLPSKKCSDLNTDLTWFKTAYAELPLSKMPVYELSLNVLLDESGPSSEKGGAIKAAYPQAFERALARCAAQPVGLYWDALKSELPGKR